MKSVLISFVLTIATAHFSQPISDCLLRIRPRLVSLLNILVLLQSANIKKNAACATTTATSHLLSTNELIAAKWRHFAAIWYFRLALSYRTPQPPDGGSDCDRHPALTYQYSCIRLSVCWTVQKWSVRSPLATSQPPWWPSVKKWM